MFFLKRIHDFDCAIQLLNDEFLIEFLLGGTNQLDAIKGTVKRTSSDRKVTELQSYRNIQTDKERKKSRERELI